MRGAVLALVIALALLVLLGGAGGASGSPMITPEDEPILVYEIDIEADGTAEWNVSARFPLANESDDAAFDELADIYEEDGGEEYLPIDPYEIAVEQLDEEFDRTMELQDEVRTIRRTDEMGVLALSFRWVGFAEVDGDRVVMGDVFAGERHTWFSHLGENEYLVIQAPDNHTVESSGLPMENRTMLVSGPTELEAGDLYGNFAREPERDGGSAMPPIWWGVSGAVVLALAISGLLYLGWLPRERRREAEGIEETTTDVSEHDEAAREDDVPDEALLGDEERVLQLIRRNGGRMKQADIVTETDWSNAKVSQLLTQMNEDGEIEKLRIGRENLIRLPDEDR